MIYIVDDDDAVRESLQFMLEIDGYPVRTFSSGEAFFEAIPETGKGTVLLDLHMPGMGGLGVLQRLSDAAAKQFNVYVITGAADDPEKEKARELGVERVFEKPFDPVDLIGEVVKDLATAMARPVAT